MSRVIKFRAWNDDINSMVLERLVMLDNGKWVDDRGFEVMQFTGLTDKNGVDIYEGDIVHARANNSNYTVCNGEYELSSHCNSEPHECVGFYLSRHNGFPFDECESIGGDCNYIKVIGNIHQNPELLKG